MASFGERIKRLREERLENQGDIAKLLNVSRATISKYETNDREPDFKCIKILAKHFGVTIDYLFGENDIKNMPDTVKENIKLIMGNMTVTQFSQSIKDKTGVHIQETEIEDYLTHKYIPTIATLSLLAEYIGTDIEFFYKVNSNIDKNANFELKEKNSIYNTVNYKKENLLRDAQFIRLANLIIENNLDLNLLENIIKNIIELKNT